MIRLAGEHEEEAKTAGVPLSFVLHRDSRCVDGKEGVYEANLQALSAIKEPYLGEL